MNTSETVTVDLGDRRYDIVVGEDVFARSGELMAPVLRQKRVIVITDETVGGLHLDALSASLDKAGIAHEAIVLPAGEQTKDFANLESLMNRILDAGIERRTALVALGGGVIGDITGFAAAIALRGIDFIQIPTTLLAQVDSSVGGKTGINTQHGKNLIGAFHQPRLVIADTGILDTLPERELLAGYAEVVKYGLLGDADFFRWLEGHGPAVIDGDPDARRHAVVHSCRMKADIVAADERETGKRALLNLGHTFGHALEAETGMGDALLHGEGVAIGMVLAFDLSVQLGHCDAVDADLARRHIAAVGLPTTPAHALGNIWSGEALIGHMAKDKKVADGKITFILARGIGDSFISQEVSRDALTTLFEGAMLP
jgi:3-dehydroquinate synthase